MIFIAGSTEKEKSREEGFFNCPICKQNRKYIYATYRNYISIFFIPIIPYGSVRESLSCTYCKTNMPISVLKDN